MCPVLLANENGNPKDHKCDPLPLRRKVSTFSTKCQLISKGFVDLFYSVLRGWIFTRMCHVQCPICIEDFNAGEELAGLECGHQYHVQCFEDWMDRGLSVCKGGSAGLGVQGRECRKSRASPQHLLAAVDGERWRHKGL